MTFLNWAMLAGLAAVAIPIIIHLLNRQKATLVDWGAMRFLLESLTSRSRRILIEEIILMALRCLAVALLVLALARPFMPSHTTIPWAFVLPAFLAGVILAGIAAAMWPNVRTRWILLAISGGLIGAAVLASALEATLQTRQWSLGGGQRDVAIVIDGSTSMTVPIEGQTNFERAVEEARTVVAACRPADTVSLLVAGPIPRPFMANPTTDRKEIEDTLKTMTPTGGSMRVLDSLIAASASLAQGHNAAKKIVLISDGQGVGWETRNEARWQFLATVLKEFPAAPEILFQSLAMPKTLRNAAVADARFSRRIVGTDRPVRIDVTVANSGTTILEPLKVELLVDGISQAHQEAGQMPVGAAETVRFDHKFDTPGPHIVTARVLSEDEIPSDNTAVRVLEVVDKLPVLVVEGDPSIRPLDGAAAFIEIALAPADEGTASSAPGGAKAATAAEDKLGNIVTLTHVAAPEIQSVRDFKPYHLVILTNVPRLPAAVATSLAKYVQEGGGVLVVLGDKVVPTFYNGWVSEGGEAVMPATLTKRRLLADVPPAHLGLKTFSHPALELLADTTQSDAERALVNAYWCLDASQRDRNVRVGALLDTGDPLLVERQFGKGRVLMTAIALDRRESNLPSLKCFVPLVHELAYYLAAPEIVQANVRPGSEFVLELPFKSPEAKAAAAAKKSSDGSLAGQVEIVTPTDRHVTAAVADTPNGARITFAGTYEPGLYHVVLPAKATDRYAVPRATREGVPFVVLDDAEESRMVPLADADLEAAGKHVKLVRVNSEADLAKAVMGNVPGEELWKYLAMALLVALLAEIGLARWIAMQRRIHQVETVSFGPATVDIQTFRDRIRSLLTVENKEPESASKP
jgi:hypothetical protein